MFGAQGNITWLCSSQHPQSPVHLRGAALLPYCLYYLTFEHYFLFDLGRGGGTFHHPSREVPATQPNL
jgi:hypothetical protein